MRPLTPSVIRKSLHRLRQSPCCFYRKLNEVLAQKGYIRIPANYGVWILRQEVVLLAHMGDMQLFGTKEGIDILIDVLKTVCKIKRFGETGQELFLGLRITRGGERGVGGPLDPVWCQNPWGNGGDYYPDFVVC